MSAPIDDTHRRIRQELSCAKNLREARKVLYANFEWYCRLPGFAREQFNEECADILSGMPAGEE